MDTVKINLDEIKLGSVLAEDILANTQYPIAYKDTRVDRDMLMVFQAFNISMIPISKQSIESKKEVVYTKEIFKTDEQNFEKKLKTSVQKFKSEFSKWEAGSKVDIVKARDIVMPLIDEMITDRTKIFTLNDYADSREYIYHHSVAVALVAAVIANKMKYNKGDVLQIATAALLADCGMAKISKRIRMKPGALNEFEFKEIMNHPLHSLKMVKDIPILKKK